MLQLIVKDIFILDNHKMTSLQQQLESCLNKSVIVEFEGDDDSDNSFTRGILKLEKRAGLEYVLCNPQRLIPYRDTIPREESVAIARKKPFENYSGLIAVYCKGK